MNPRTLSEVSDVRRASDRRLVDTELGLESLDSGIVVSILPSIFCRIPARALSLFSEECGCVSGQHEGKHQPETKATRTWRDTHSRTLPTA